MMVFSLQLRLVVPLLLATYGNDLARDDASCMVQMKTKAQAIGTQGKTDERDIHTKSSNSYNQSESKEPCSTTVATTDPNALPILVNLVQVKVRNVCKSAAFMGREGDQNPKDTLRLDPDATVFLTDSQVKQLLGGRLQVSLQPKMDGLSDVNEIYTVVELNNGFPGLGITPKSSSQGSVTLNFIGQDGWNPLNVDIAFEKVDGSGLACTDGRGWTTFGSPTLDCNFPDGSGIITSHTHEGLVFAACASKYRHNPTTGKYYKEACTAYQSIYLVNNSWLETASFPQQGTKSARSCGYDFMGFKQAVFADGHVCKTTFQNQGRENGGRSAMNECFEQPCVWKVGTNYTECVNSQQYVSVGTQGFFICSEKKPGDTITTNMTIELSCHGLQ